jgi:beta-glucosidase-like glycosyl hydrolase/CubicO group peptidase (beta-lactamase class C family)
MSKPYTVNYLLKYLIIILLIAFPFRLFAQYFPDDYVISDKKEAHWVDSVLRTFNLEEKIGQLIMVRVYANDPKSRVDSITKDICEYNLGGLIFFKGGPVGQAKMTNYYQNIAKTPLFIAIDGEWGLGMRMKDSAMSFPKQMTLGAITDNKLIYDMGKETAREFKRIGLTINFAPVVDINSNPRNPVINTRSFGEDKENVAQKGLAYTKGMQDNGLLGSAKHFPGHGDTDKDSHKTLPVINHNINQIENTDLYPFKELISGGVSSVMVGHLFIPALETTDKLASSLSKNVITKQLKQKMCYDGLIFTDALDMKGITDFNDPGEASLNALLAGNDILLLPANTDSTVKKIKEAVYNGIIIEQELDYHCKKILSYKYRVGLNKYKPVKLKNISEDINTPSAELLNRKLYEASLTLVLNNNLIPIQRADTFKLATLSVGSEEKTSFQSMIDNYAPVTHFNLGKNFKKKDADSIVKILSAYELVIIGLHNNTNTPNDSFGVHLETIRLVDSIKNKTKVVLTVFTVPYSIGFFHNLGNAEAIICANQNNNITQELAAQLIFGGVEAKGRLPVSVSQSFPLNTGMTSAKLRLKYSLPEEAGLNSKYFRKIDSIAQKGVKDEIYPGCQIVVVKDGLVIHEKSYGFHTYEPKQFVTNSDIYDIASVTKVAATTLAVMKLYERGVLNLNWKLGDILPALKNSNKANLCIKDVMTHQAKLKAWIPFYKETLNNGKLDTNIYRKIPSEKFALRVADSIYINKSYTDSIFSEIANSDLRDNNSYVYSDLGFYLMKEIVEKLSHKTLDKYVRDNFYKPLGLATMCFNPRNYYPLNRIVPSENDTVFRKQIVQGDVNDQGAAMLGGVSGHAGLFSDANDLAVLFQMLMNGGEYAGVRYLQDSTIKRFTSYQYNNNRRGLGFDKQVPDAKQAGPCCKEASTESFGHSGFTGTFVWADPKYHVTYIFLSNRTFPYSTINRLADSGIRTKIQSLIYKAIEEGVK